MSESLFSQAETALLNTVVGAGTALSDALALPPGTLPFLPTGTFAAISSGIDTLDNLANATGLTTLASDPLGAPESLINGTAIGGTTLGIPQSMGFVAGAEPAIVPIEPSAATPTVAQFLDAANAEYTLGGTPPGMRPFLVDGRQLGITNEITGLSAKVWVTDQNQIIIAYQGTTGGDNLLVNPLIALTQVATDVQIYAKTTPQAETGALAFAREVIGYAAQQGISPGSVFVTGHSLGGIEAEYVAQQTGLGGIGFEPTGIPKSATAAGTGANFVDVVTYGDPVGNYASDIKGEQPFAPAYAPGQSGSLPHYGQVVMIGTPSDQTQLTQAVASWNNPGLNQLTVPATLAVLMAEYHLPGTQAHDLGIALSPLGVSDTLGSMNGTVFPAGGYTIPQFIKAYDAAHGIAASALAA